MIANYRVAAELSAIDSTDDGLCIVLGTVDGCVSVMSIADPDKPEMAAFLSEMPSRDEQASTMASLQASLVLSRLCHSLHFQFSLNRNSGLQINTSFETSNMKLQNLKLVLFPV